MAIHFAVRRYLTNEDKTISAVMDACDYVVIEAHPDQAAFLKSDFERNGWPFRSATEAAGPESGADFQLKIKAQGPRSDLDA